MPEAIPEWILNVSDDQLAGFLLRPDSDRGAGTPRFLREQTFKRRMRCFTRGAEGSDRRYDPIDISDWEFDVGVGAIDKAPTAETFSLAAGVDLTGLTGLAYNISETALATAFQSNPTFTLISTCTVVVGTTMTVGAVHGLVAGDRIRFTSTGTLPAPLAAGTDYYVLTAPTTTTLTIALTQGGSVISFSNTGSGTHSIRLTVTAQQEGQEYTVTVSAKGARPAVTSDASLLYPPSDVLISQSVVGDSTHREVLVIEVIQQPWARSTSWTPVTEGTVAPTTLEVGDQATPYKAKVVFSEPPMGGSVLIKHDVPQITELRCSDNTASGAEWEIDFEPVLGAEATLNGQYLETYDVSDAIVRFWFNRTSAPTAGPGTPPGGTLIQVDYTTVASLVTAFQVAADAALEYSAVQISTYRVRVTHASAGSRTPIDLTFCSVLQAAGTHNLSNGSDGILAGKWFPLGDRLGLTIVYLTAGLTTDIPEDLDEVEYNRLIEVPIGIGSADSVVADAIKTIIDADAEFSATQGGAKVTITDVYGGTRVISTTKTVNFGVTVTRAGFCVTASIPWESEANTITALLGNDDNDDSRYIVSKPDALTWFLTLRATGEHPDLEATDENLVWPSRVEGELDFSGLPIRVAFGLNSTATNPNRLDGLLEIKGAPSGETKRVLLQIGAECFKNMLRNGAGSITPYAGPLTSLLTQNTLWVMKNGNDGTGTRGRFDKPFLTPEGVKAAALAGDTICVLPGAYTCTGSLVKTGVHWHFEAGASVTLDDESADGIWDDGGSAASYQVTGAGDFIRTAGSGSLDPAYLIRTAHASSVVKIECHDLSITQNSASDDIGSAVTGEAGILSVKCRRINAGGTSVNVYAIWWKNGDLQAKGDDIVCTGTASSYYSEVTATPTGDAHIEFNDYNGTVGSIGSNATAASWVRGNIIRNTASTAGVNAGGSERLYVTVQKVFGGIRAVAGLLYLTSDKVSAVVNGTSGAANLLHCAGGDVRASVGHWDPDGFTGQTIKITSGTARLRDGGDFTTGAANGIELTGGTGEIDLAKVDASANSGTNPVIFSGGTPILGAGLYLKAQGARDTVETSGAALTIYAKGAFGNNNVDSAAIIVGTFDIKVLP
jgi:hypothetical protein